MPMYCGAFSFKDVFDTKDMRSTGGADVSYAMDAAPEDSTIVAPSCAPRARSSTRRRISPSTTAAAAIPAASKATTRTYGAGARSTWARHVLQRLRHARARPAGRARAPPLRSAPTSSTCSICEETGGSCRQPAWRNGVVALVTTKGLIPYGGAIGAEPYLDRAGHHLPHRRATPRSCSTRCRTPERGYFDPRDIYSALPTCARLRSAVRQFHASRPDAVAAQAARRHAHRHRARVHGEARRQRRGDERPGRRGDQARAARPARRRRWSSRPIPKYPDDPAIPNMDVRLPAGAGRDPADPHARVLQQKNERRGAAVRRDRLRRHASATTWSSSPEGLRRCRDDLNLRSDQQLAGARRASATTWRSTCCGAATRASRTGRA